MIALFKVPNTGALTVHAFDKFPHGYQGFVIKTQFIKYNSWASQWLTELADLKIWKLTSLASLQAACDKLRRKALASLWQDYKIFFGDIYKKHFFTYTFNSTINLGNGSMIKLSDIIEDTRVAHILWKINIVHGPFTHALQEQAYLYQMWPTSFSPTD